jgi:hypothetical protein
MKTFALMERFQAFCVHRVQFACKWMNAVFVRVNHISDDSAERKETDAVFFSIQLFCIPHGFRDNLTERALCLLALSCACWLVVPCAVRCLSTDNQKLIFTSWKFREQMRANTPVFLFTHNFHNLLVSAILLKYLNILMFLVH